MDVAADTLSDDVETLKAMLLAERAKLAAVEEIEAQLLAQIEENKVLQAERIRLGDAVETLTAQNERYEHIIAQLGLSVISAPKVTLRKHIFFN
jgi:regulator of replication initiation timing